MRGIRGAGYAQGGIVDAAHQHGEFLDGVVDRVGDRSRDVFRYRSAYRQVAVGEVAHFVHQPQDGALGCVLLRFCKPPLVIGFVAAAQAFVIEGLDHEHQHQQCQGTEDGRGDGGGVLVGNLAFIGLDQALGACRHAAETGDEGSHRSTGFCQGLEITRQGGKRRQHRLQLLRQRRVGGGQFRRRGDVPGQLRGHGLVEARAPGQLGCRPQDPFRQNRELAAGGFRRFGDGLALLCRIGGKAIDRNKAILLRQQ